MAEYNINAATRRVVLSGSAGTGPYSFTFAVLVQTDLAVYLNSTKLTLTTDYTVSISANGTGSVTLNTGTTNVPTTPTSSDSIIIVGARALERTTDFVTAGDLRASALNEQLDANVIFDQQLAEENQRTVKAPVFDPATTEGGGTVDMTLPAKDTRKGKYLAFNDTTGNPEAGPSVSDVTTVSAAATDIALLADIQDGTTATNAITTVAANNANVTTVAGISGNVTTVAGISSDVTAVASDATDIGTVSSNISNVNTVAGVSANVTTVAGISSNVTTVAGISSNVTAVANDATDIGTVATNIADVNTAASNITDIQNASTNAATATTKASEAATSATNAASSATAAASSATAAASSQTAAAASAASAASAFDNFDDTYLGSKTSDPTVDNDGNALVAGALYFNDSTNEMRVYDGANWIAATSAGNVSLILYEYTATAGQTTFSGSDDNSATLSYTVDNLQVVMNGVVLDPADFTATNGTSVVLDSGATVGDQINIYAFKSFTTADMVSKTAGGTFSGAVGFGGGITGDVSFDTNTLHVDSANNAVGIGTTSPSNATLDVTGRGRFLQDAAATTGAVVIRESSGGVGGHIQFVTNDNATQRGFIASNSSGDILLGTSAERMRILSGGLVGVGTAAPDTFFDVAGTGVPLEVDSTNSNGFKVQFKDAGTLRGYIGSTSTVPFYVGDASANVIFQNQSAGNIVQTASGAASWQYALNCTASSGQLLGHIIQFTAQVPNNASNYFLWMTDTSAARAYFKSDGGLANFQGNNANLSDEREKKNIEDAQDAWTTVKSWQVRKFHFNEDADSDDKRYGVIAQEFQAHCPELITDYNKSPDPTSDPVTRLAVKEQGAMWLAIKALQEAQAKIEALEARVATLEGN